MYCNVCVYWCYDYVCYNSLHFCVFVIMFILCVLLLCFVVYIHCWWYLVMVGGFRKKLQSSFSQLRWFDRILALQRIRCWWSCNWQQCQKGMFLSCNDPRKKGGLAFPLVSYSTIPSGPSRDPWSFHTPNKNTVVGVHRCPRRCMSWRKRPRGVE